jgi:hypothetical protein
VSPEDWLVEIAAAYQDAREAIPFGPAVGESFGEAELFHLAPIVALKFRGLRRTARRLKRATEAALASYVASQEGNAAVFERPQFAFAFCYVASHLGLGLLSETEAEGLIDYVERNGQSLTQLIERTARGAQP